MAQDGKGGEERRKQDEVAHKIEPETEGLHLGGIGVFNFFVMSDTDGRSVCGHHLPLRHRFWDSLFSAEDLPSCQLAKRSFSIRSTSAAGMM